MRRDSCIVRTAVIIGALAMAFPSAARAATITLSGADFRGSVPKRSSWRAIGGLHDRQCLVCRKLMD